MAASHAPFCKWAHPRLMTHCANWGSHAVQPTLTPTVAATTVPTLALSDAAKFDARAPSLAPTDGPTRCGAGSLFWERLNRSVKSLVRRL